VTEGFGPSTQGEAKRVPSEDTKEYEPIAAPDVTPHSIDGALGSDWLQPVRSPASKSPLIKISIGLAAAMWIKRQKVQQTSVFFKNMLKFPYNL